MARFAGYANSLASVKRSDFPAAILIATDEELAAFVDDFGLLIDSQEPDSFVALARAEEARRAAK